jgi:hypothetical protein
LAASDREGVERRGSRYLCRLTRIEATPSCIEAPC